MSIDRIEQTREIGDYEVTVAINTPLRVGELDILDKRISSVLDGISNILEKRKVVSLELNDIEVQELIWFLTPSHWDLSEYADNMMSAGKGTITDCEKEEYIAYLGKLFESIRERLEILEKGGEVDE